MSSYIITSCHLLSLSPSASRFMLGSHLRVSWWRLTAAELAFSVVPYVVFFSMLHECIFVFIFLGGVIVVGAVAIQQESQLFESLLWLSRLEVLWSRSCMFVFCNCPYVNININHRSTLILKWPTNSILKNDLRGKIELLFQSQTGCWGIASQMWPPGGMFETLRKWIDVFMF